MAATRHTLTADLADLLDDALPVAANGKSKVHVYLKTNLPDSEALVDTSANKVFLSGGAKEIAHDNGVFSVDLISTDSTDINVDGLQYRIVASYVSPKGSGSNPAVAERKTWDSGYFDLTADADLADVADAIQAPVGWRSEFITEMEALQQAASDAAAAAQAVAIGAASLQPSKNLYDKDADYGLGTFWNGAQTTPVTSGYPTYYASPKITLTRGATYTINNARNIAFFKADGSLAGTRYINNPSEGPVTFTLGDPAQDPSGVEQMIGFNVTAATRPTAQLELGSSATSYEKFGIKIPDLLSGGRYLDEYLADTAAGVDAAKRAGGILVYASGNELSVRSAFDATRDIIMPVHLAGQTISTHEVSVILSRIASQANVALVPATATDAQVWPVVDTNVITDTAAQGIHGPSDDNTPINVQWSYVGGNHPYNAGSKVTKTGHGMTSADLGSTWSDGTRTYTLVKIDDANNVTFANPYTVSSSVVTGGTTIPAATLTHVSGATHTGNIAITGGVSLVELGPSTHSRSVVALIDGKPLRDGNTAGQVLTITETYLIVSYKGLVDWAQANVGSNPFTNLPSMTQLARVSNTYRFTRSQVTVSQKVTALEKFVINMGVTQAIPLTVYSGWSKKQFMPTIGSVGGLDFSTLADLSGMSADINIGSGQFGDALNPPQRMVQWVYDGSNVPQYGLSVGILPVADGAPAQRLKNASTRAWFISNSFKKNYPQIAWGKTLNVGDSLSGTGYRTYLAPPDTTAEVVVSDGSDTWAFLDRPASSIAAGLMKVPQILGKRLQPVGPQKVSGVPERVTGEGITYAVGSAPGYGGWKAIEEKVHPPALLGANKVVGDYFTYSGVKSTTTLLSQILYLWPMTLPLHTPIDRAMLDVSVLGTGVVRHGVYAHDPETGMPVLTGPLADFGTLDVTATGIKGDADLAAAVTLPPIYWYAVCWQGTSTTSPTIRVLTVPTYMGPLDLGSASPTSSATSSIGYRMSSVSGAFGALTGLVPHGVAPPAVIFRRAAA